MDSKLCIGGKKPTSIGKDRKFPAILVYDLFIDFSKFLKNFRIFEDETHSKLGIRV